MRRIKLTQGRSASVDNRYYDTLVGMGSWHFDAGYAVRNVTRSDGSQRKIMMHRVVARLEGHRIAARQIDHRDMNTLNNQALNLRPATKSQNMRNRPRNKNNRSGFKGVSWNAKVGKWAATIRLNGKQKHLGYFTNKLNAARAYDRAALARDPHYHFLNFSKSP